MVRGWPFGPFGPPQTWQNRWAREPGPSSPFYVCGTGKGSGTQRVSVCLSEAVVRASSHRLVLVTSGACLGVGGRMLDRSVERLHTMLLLPLKIPPFRARATVHTAGGAIVLHVANLGLASCMFPQA